MSKKKYDKQHQDSMDKVEYLMYINDNTTNTELKRIVRSIALRKRMELKLKKHERIR